MGLGNFVSLSGIRPSRPHVSGWTGHQSTGPEVGDVEPEGRTEWFRPPEGESTDKPRPVRAGQLTMTLDPRAGTASHRPRKPPVSWSDRSDTRPGQSTADRCDRCLRVSRAEPFAFIDGI